MPHREATLTRKVSEATAMSNGSSSFTPLLGSIGYMLDRCLGDVRRQAREANKLIIVVGIVEYATKLPNSVLVLFKNEIVAEVNHADGLLHELD
jgi:hypothetical protein